jgi:hypothetical protein
MFSGFLQGVGDLNGCVKIFLELHRATLSPDTRVELRPWSCDVADVAEMISRLHPLDRMPRVCVYGYSWGGKTAENFCRELHRRGLDVEQLVLCDAVYRHWYRLGQWRALARWSVIRIPGNVQHVTHFRQRQSWLLRGHAVQAENPGLTNVRGVRWLKCEHSWMDDSPEFRNACLDAAMTRRPK